MLVKLFWFCCFFFWDDILEQVRVWASCCGRLTDVQVVLSPSDGFGPYFVIAQCACGHGICSHCRPSMYVLICVINSALLALWLKSPFVLLSGEFHPSRMARRHPATGGHDLRGEAASVQRAPVWATCSSIVCQTFLEVSTRGPVEQPAAGSKWARTAQNGSTRYWSERGDVKIRSPSKLSTNCLRCGTNVMNLSFRQGCWWVAGLCAKWLGGLQTVKGDWQLRS